MDLFDPQVTCMAHHVLRRHVCSIFCRSYDFNQRQAADFGRAVGAEALAVTNHFRCKQLEALGKLKDADLISLLKCGVMRLIDEEPVVAHISHNQ